MQGLPCQTDDDCGPQVGCIGGLCGGLGGEAVCGNWLLEDDEECDDGNTRGGDGCSSNCIIPPPAAPLLEFSHAPVKRFEFSWDPALGAEYYQLLERLASDQEYAQIGQDITGGFLTMPMPLFSRTHALYKLRACNAWRCADSNIVAVSGTLVDAVGYFKASNTNAGDLFGGSMALSGDGGTLVVGAASEDSGAAGINGDEDDESAIKAGAVYVLVRDNWSWVQQAYVKPTNPGAYDGFGSSVSLSSDGSTLVVGAAYEDSGAVGIDGDRGDDESAVNAGAVYVFVRKGGVWTEQAYIKASNTGQSDFFGGSVSLSADGRTLAVGAMNEDSGASGINGEQGDDEGFDNAGAVYLFVREGSSWSQQAYIKASNPGGYDFFGGRVALSSDGQTLAVSSMGERSSASGIDGAQDDDTLEVAGAAYVFARTAAQWSQQAYVKASSPREQDRFGSSIALSANGNTLAVGAEGAGVSMGETVTDVRVGAVYVFTRNTADVWSQQVELRAPHAGEDDSFGSSVALSSSGRVLAVGAPKEDGLAVGVSDTDDGHNDAAPDAGAVYLFVHEDEGWLSTAYIKPSNTGGGYEFGSATALSSSGETLAVSAAREDSESRGVNGDQPNDGAFDAGAVYLY